MSNKTIAKFYVFVISFAAAATFFSACSDISSDGHKIEPQTNFDPPKIVGEMKSDDIIESSGIVASRCQSDVIWTHNDSDEGPYIFAFKPTGENLGTWKIPGSENIDWEDIAAFKDKSGRCFLYIGDIGNNESQFSEHAIYRVVEPIVKEADSRSNRKNSINTEAAEVVRYRYPDTKQNAETLVVQPMTGSIYVLTKRLVGPSGVYRIKPDFGKSETQKAQIIAEISLPAIPNGLLTGGDISPDGKRVILCDYSQGYEFTLPDGAANFDEIWLQKPKIVDLGERNQGESVCYSVDGSSIFATSEGQRSPVIEVKRR